MPHALLLGESAGSARYLTGALAEGGYTLRHIEGREQLDRLDELADVVIISDYPARHLSANAAEAIVAAVEGGAGFVMLGGWGSFTGQGDGYGQTPIAGILPVLCADEDDRRNVASGVWLAPTDAEHPILRGLDFSAPPVVCGYNAVTTRADATLILHGRHVAFNGGQPSLGAQAPLLAVRSVGQGRAAAYTSDFAPHWCGGLVDWGDERRTLSSGAEVGALFVRFALNLFDWASGR